MTTQEALQLLDSAVAQMTLQRQQHVQLQMAVKTLQDALREVQPRAEVAEALNSRD